MKKPFHPLLFAIYPLLALYSANTALIPPVQVFAPLVGLLIATSLIWLALFGLFRKLDRAAVIASVVVLLFFSYGHWKAWLYADPRRGEFWDSVYVGICLILVVLAGWRRKNYLNLTQFMNVVAVALVVLPLLSIATSFISGRVVPTVGMGAGDIKIRQRPNVYYVILDGHGRTDAMEKIMGYSNRGFIEQLEQLGFFIPKQARTNYVQTELSLSSSLNYDYMQGLLPHLNGSSEDREPLDALVTDSRVAEMFKRAGYTYIALTTGFPRFKFKSADMALGTVSSDGLLMSSLIALTPLPDQGGLTGLAFDRKRADVRNAFRNLVELSVPTAKPKFVFAHILAPHPPFVFNSDGSARPAEHAFALVDGTHFYQHGGTEQLYREGYVNQVQYTDTLVLQTARAIERNDPNSIIIFQGDHGSKMHLDQDSLAGTNVDEVVPIFLAIHVPAGLAKTLPQDLTPVNEFRYILNYLFEVKLPILENHSYYSTWTKPYDFKEVSSNLTGR